MIYWRRLYHPCYHVCHHRLRWRAVILPNLDSDTPISLLFISHPSRLQTNWVINYTLIVFWFWECRPRLLQPIFIFIALWAAIKMKPLIRPSSIASSILFMRTNTPTLRSLLFILLFFFALSFRCFQCLLSRSLKIFVFIWID